MSDLLTILRSETKRLAKVWRADGSIAPYDQAKWFTFSQVPVADIHELAALLKRLESDPHSCLIRGTPTSETKKQTTVRRLIESFDDVPLSTLLIEVDGFEPILNDPLTEPLDAALEYLAEAMPSAFQGVSFSWQLSNSAGAPSNGAKLKIHIWVMLETPYDSAVLSAWAKAENLALDRAVLQRVQIHYLSAPVFEDGVVDPVPVRSGFFQGARDTAPLVIDTEALQIKGQTARLRGERLGIEDPVADWIETNWETYETLPNGGVVIACPFADEHGSDRKEGDSSTVFFPAGSNGYAEGAFSCLHNSCRDRPKSAFLAKCGYADQRLAVLAAPEDDNLDADRGDLSPVVRRQMALINGQLPPFVRTQGGEILATLDNLSRALARSDVCGMSLKLDSFKEEIVWADVDGSAWSSFRDVHYTELRMRLEAIGFKAISKEMMRDAVHHYADANSFDTAIDWLTSLKWDGVPRVEKFWIEHFGVIDDERGYARSVGRYAWTAMAGRVIEPGVQADMVPILAGRQGIGKSRGVAAMSPQREFTTSMTFDEPEIDRSRKMRGKLIIELAELQGLKTRERESIKGWITKVDEHWTPKFQEFTTTFKRRSIFYGTTNDDDFLDDPTGERRWLPLGVGETPGFLGVDFLGICTMRDQLWAEGAEMFSRTGVAWEAAQRLAPGAHETYRSEDLWQTALSKWLDAPDMASETPRALEYLTTQMVAEGALMLPARQVKHGDQRRIGAALRAEGYELTPKRFGKDVKKVWTRKG